MKRYVTIFLIFLLVVAMVGCGEYTTPITPPQSGDGAEDGEPVIPSTPSEDLKNDPTAFTVALRYNGQPYIPRAKDEVVAQWTDGFTFHTAKFGEDGVARVAGLDGDYQVTIKGLPVNRVYNPNDYVATNKQRSIVIDLYSPVHTSYNPQVPTNLYQGCIHISKTGVYRIQLNSPDQKVYFQYAPSASGTYTVESWVSTAEGNYNPKVDVYNGTHAYKVFSYTLNDGGISKGYTQNFKHEVSIAEEHFGTTGQAVFTFAIHADAKNEVWPMNLDFAIKLNGEFELDHINKELVIPEEDFQQTPEYDPSEYTFKWAETETLGAEGRFQYDGSMFKLWPKSEGGDGYYHLYDKETGEYGAILYAKISSPHRFTEAPFISIEAAGNSSLTVYNGTKNYKLLIQGLEDLLVDPLDFSDQAAGGSYFCVHECPCRKQKAGVCGESCTECNEDCRHLPDEIVALIDLDLEDDYDPSPDVEKVKIWSNGKRIAIPKYLAGYAAYTNADGVYAVTAEIKEFLQGFSIQQRYFADGEGWVETHPEHKVDAKEDDQWLFACGYYVKNR